MDQDVGRSLRATGWAQGVLLDPLALSVAFDPTNPVSKIARAAASKDAADRVVGDAIRHGVASGIPSSTIRLVVVSQDCDIVKRLSDEPNVIAMPVFKTENPRITGPAARNSSRYYLLDADRGYVVDAASVIVIEKPLLATLKPEVGTVTEGERKRFARWVARRFNRPAIDDNVVAAIVKPILENLRRLQASGELDMALLDHISEVRLLVANQNIPFSFDLLFMVEESDTAAFEISMAALVGQMRGWFDPSLAMLRAWYARNYADISVADYLAGDQIFLDEYSYAGGSIRGLIAPGTN